MYYSQSYFLNDYFKDYAGKFEEKGIYYLCMLGNDDLKALDEVFRGICALYSKVKDISGNKVTIDGYEFIGFNLVKDYKFRLKDRCRKDKKDTCFDVQLGTGLLSGSEGKFTEIQDWIEYANGLPTIEEELDKLPKLDDINKCIYVIHDCPAKLGLDTIYGGKQVGSESVLDFIVKQKPVLSLHGHIHENYVVTGKWDYIMDDTIIVQPGQSSALAYVVIDIGNEVILNRFEEKS